MTTTEDSQTTLQESPTSGKKESSSTNGLHTYKSPTLESLETLPTTACAGCPNGIWFIERLKPQDETGQVKVFCQLMHAVITNEMMSCDGTLVTPQEKNA